MSSVPGFALMIRKQRTLTVSSRGRGSLRKPTKLGQPVLQDGRSYRDTDEKEVHLLCEAIKARGKCFKGQKDAFFTVAFPDKVAMKVLGEDLEAGLQPLNEILPSIHGQSVRSIVGVGFCLISRVY